MNFNPSNIIEGFFGQSQIPDFQSYTPRQYLGQVGKAVPKMADINIDFNNRLGPAYARLGNQIEDIYDPNQRNLRMATTNRILGEVEHPYDMPPELVKLIQTQAMSGNAASGFGASEAGRFNLGKTLGLAGMQFGENRINRAASFTRSAPMGNQIYQPITDMTPSDVLGLAVGNVNSQNARNTYLSQLLSQNARNIIDVPLQRDMAVAQTVGSMMAMGA